MDGVNLGTEAGPILNKVLLGQCMGWDEGGQSKCGGGEGRLDGKGGLLRDSVTWGPDPKKSACTLAHLWVLVCRWRPFTPVVKDRPHRHKKKERKV